MCTNESPVFSFFFCLLCLLIASFLPVDATPAEEKQWIDAVTKLGHIAHPFKQEIASHLVNISSHVNIPISDNCRQALQKFAAGVLSDEMESMALFDSFSKPGPGLVTMQGYSLGSYDQCMIFGRYVLLGIDFPLPKDTSVKRFTSSNNDWKYAYSKIIAVRRLDPFNFAVCVPKSCDEEDVRHVFDSKYVRTKVQPFKVTVLTTESMTDSMNISMRQWTAIALLLAFLILGTIAAVMNSYFPATKVSEHLKTFDCMANTATLFTIKDQSPQSMFTNVNLIRASYFVNSIYTHLAIGIQPATQMIRMERLPSYREHLTPVKAAMSDIIIMSVPGAMCLNMTLAAAFAAVKWIPAMTRGRISFFHFAMERVARSLPVVFVYFLMTQVLPLTPVGSGPLFKRVQVYYADVCARNGWKELLFVNNFDPDIRQICNPIAWFVSAEFQLYITSFVVLMMIAKFPKSAGTILTANVLIGIILTAGLFLWNGVSPIASFRIVDLQEEFRDYTAKIYHTLNYVSVYAIGIWLGLKILHHRGQKHRVSWSLFSLFCLLSGVLVLPYLAYDSRDTHTFIFGPVAEVCFAALIRSAFALLLSLYLWVIMNSSNRILTYLSRTKIVTLIARLSLSWFMVHTMFVTMIIAFHADGRFSSVQVMMEQCFLLLASFPAAVAMHVFVEMPFSNLWNNYKKGKRPVTTNSDSPVAAAAVVDESSKDK